MSTKLQNSFAADTVEAKLKRLSLVAGHDRRLHMDDAVLYDDIACALAQLAAKDKELTELRDAGELLLVAYEGFAGDLNNNAPRMMRAAIDAARQQGGSAP